MARRGRVAGVDGVGAAWVAAVVEGSWTSVAVRVSWRVGPAADVLALAAECDMVAVDVPIGVVPHGLRAAEVEARRLLGPAAGSVFATPPAPALDVARRDGVSRATRPVAQEEARRSGGHGISTQSWGLVAKILEVEDALTGLGWQAASRVVEAHPETAFRAMAGGGSWPGKRSAAGAARRLAALGLPLALLDDPVLARVPLDDAVDALAAAWTADRVVRDDAAVLGASDAGSAVWSDGTPARGRCVIWV